MIFFAYQSRLDAAFAYFFMKDVYLTLFGGEAMNLSIIQGTGRKIMRIILRTSTRSTRL